VGACRRGARRVGLAAFRQPPDTGTEVFGARASHSERNANTSSRRERPTRSATYRLVCAAYMAGGAEFNLAAERGSPRSSCTSCGRRLGPAPTGLAVVRRWPNRFLSVDVDVLDRRLRRARHARARWVTRAERFHACRHGRPRPAWMASRFVEVPTRSGRIRPASPRWCADRIVREALTGLAERPTPALTTRRPPSSSAHAFTGTASSAAADARPRQRAAGVATLDEDVLHRAAFGPRGRRRPAVRSRPSAGIEVGHEKPSCGPSHCGPPRGPSNRTIVERRVQAWTTKSNLAVHAASRGSTRPRVAGVEDAVGGVARLRPGK